MRRLIPLIAGLYPRPWRERYGEEFSALLEDLNPGAGTAVNILEGAIVMQIRTWRYAWMVAISAALATTAFAVMLFTIPNNYVSQGTLLLNGATPFSQADLDSLNEMAHEVESRRSLTNLITSDSLYLHQRSRMEFEDVIELMRRDVTIEPAGGQDSVKLLVVGFRYPDAKIAQRISQKLMASFIDANFRSGGARALSILDPPSFPLRPTRSSPALVTVSLLIGLLTLGLLSVFRWRAMRRA